MLARKSHSQNIRPLLAAIIVATGLAVVWAFLSGWGSSVIGGLFSTASVQERLRIAADGTPVIVSVTDNGQLDVGRRTLDGDTWPNDYEHWIGGAFFTQPSRKNGLLETPLPWNQRYTGGSDGKKPPTAWYLLCNAETQGRAYFMGFDAFSKLPIGYIGTKGFRMTPLPEEELFQFPEYQSFSKRGLGNGEMVSTQSFSRYDLVRSWRHELVSEQRILPWLVYLTDMDHLLEIDLRKRSVRTALEMPGIRKVSWLSEEVIKAKSPDVEAVPDVDTKAGRPLTASPPVRLVSTDSWNSLSSVTGTFSAFVASSPEKIETEKRLVILTDDRIVIYDPPTNKQREFQLPGDRKFLEGAFNAYLVEPEKLLVTYNTGYWEKGYVQQMFWMTLDGKVERQERLELAGYRPPSERRIEWAIAGLAPLPIVWLGKTLGFEPWKRLQYHRDNSYASAVRNALKVAWLPMIVVALVALVMAGIAMRWHRRYRRSQTGAWWLMVFLFGPMGLLAYWLQQKRAVLEPCASCGKEIPRDRGECADCGAEFPVPELRGTEIFA